MERSRYTSAFIVKSHIQWFFYCVVLQNANAVVVIAQFGDGAKDFQEIKRFICDRQLKCHRVVLHIKLSVCCSCFHLSLSLHKIPNGGSARQEITFWWCDHEIDFLKKYFNYDLHYSSPRLDRTTAVCHYYCHIVVCCWSNPDLIC